MKLTNENGSTVTRRWLKFILLLVPVLCLGTFFYLQVSLNNDWIYFRQKHTENTTSAQRILPYNPIPTDEILKNMSHSDLQALYHRYINSPQVTCSGVERMGLVTDGGWEICDDPRWRPNWTNCLVYSFGINFDFSFDDEVAKLGCEVHSFDPSMERKNYQRAKMIYFHDEGISGVDSAPNDKNWPLHTLKTHRRLLHHSTEERRLDIVKMDIEGWELKSLLTALEDGSLSDVRQLNFETHLTFAKTEPSKEDYLKFLKLMRKVYEKGFRIYLTHRNYVYSAFKSSLVPYKNRVKCHEVHTVNVNLVNGQSGLPNVPPAKTQNSKNPRVFPGPGSGVEGALRRVHVQDSSLSLYKEKNVTHSDKI